MEAEEGMEEVVEELLHDLNGQTAADEAKAQAHTEYYSEAMQNLQRSNAGKVNTQ